MSIFSMPSDVVQMAGCGDVGTKTATANLLRTRLADAQEFHYLCFMRFLKPIVSLVMALLIGVTSLGVAVSAHTCAESGFSEAGIGHLKICCKVAEGKGFRAEPCCKLSVQQVKLATVRTATDAAPLLLLKWQATVPALPMVATVPQPAFASTALQARPPEPPPLLATVDAQAFIRQFLI